MAFILIHGLTISPCSISWSAISTAGCIGIANPMPWAKGMMALLIPITIPLLLTSGPPLFPGLIAASVCINPSMNVTSVWMERFNALTTPAVTVGPPTSPRGLPMAIAICPILRSFSCAISGTGSPLALILITARSFMVSRPLISAGNILPSSKATFISFEPSTTWALVSIRPSSFKIKPEPTPGTGCTCRYASFINFTSLMFTTLGITFPTALITISSKLGILITP